MTHIDNAYEMHVHGGPSFIDRKYDWIELADTYREADFGGIVMKNQFGSTYIAAGLARARVPDLDIHSALTLNSFVGGINPTAVELAVEMSASVIWLPTLSADHFQSSGLVGDFPFSNQSLSVLDDGELIPEMHEILGILDDAEPAPLLGNGHLSPEETFAIVDAIEDNGFDVTLSITHADFSFMDLTLEQQVTLADRGAIIEKCYLPVVYDDLTISEMAESVVEIGADRCVLSTDHGQADNPSPEIAYRTFLEKLATEGISDDELAVMAAETPKKVLPAQ